METTKKQSYLIMHPQKRNIHNQIFGGYIMRLAFEHAWITVYSFAKAIPTVVAIDDHSFLAPVSIGNILLFTSTITYVEGSYIHVEVIADVLDPDVEKYKTTNTVRFIFKVWSEKKVKPKTKEEIEKYNLAIDIHNAIIPRYLDARKEYMKNISTH